MCSQDQEALTVLVPLSSPEDYEGGGTAFWSVADAGPGAKHAKEGATPTMVLRPPAGKALVFGGSVTHAGQAVIGGQRCIFVASFSPQSTVPLTAAVAQMTSLSNSSAPSTMKTDSHLRIAEILRGRSAFDARNRPSRDLEL